MGKILNMNEIITQLQALDTQLQAAIVALQALNVPPPADPVIEVDVKTESGVDEIFVPKA